MLLAGALAGTAQAEEWLYAADQSNGAIYGVPTTDLGSRRMVPISGLITVCATQMVHLNADEVVLIPMGTSKVVWLHLPTGQLRELGSFADGNFVRLAPLPGGAGASLFGEGGFPALITRDDKGEWTYSRPSSELKEDRTPELGRHVVYGETCYFLVPYPSLNGSGRSFVSRVGLDGESTILEEFPIQYTRLTKTPHGFALFSADGASLHFDRDGNRIQGLNLTPELELLSVDSVAIGTDPYAIGVVSGGELRGALATQADDTTESLTLVTGPFRIGSETTDLIGAQELLPVSPTSVSFYDDPTGTIRRVNPSTRAVSQYFVLSRGSGPALEGVVAISNGPDGLLYVLDRTFAGDRIVRIDPATGNRTLLLTLVGTDRAESLAVVDSDHFIVIEREYPDTPATTPASALRVRWRPVHLVLGFFGATVTPGETLEHTLPSLDTCVTPDGTFYSAGNNPGDAALHRLCGPEVTTLESRVELSYLRSDLEYGEYANYFESPANAVEFSGVTIGLRPPTEWGWNRLEGMVTPASARSGGFARGVFQTYPATSTEPATRCGIHMGFVASRELQIRHLWVLSSTIIPPEHYSMTASRLGDIQFLLPMPEGSPIALRALGRGFFRISPDFTAIESHVGLQPVGFPAEELAQQSEAFVIPERDELYLITPEQWTLHRANMMTGETERVGQLLPNTYQVELTGNSTRPSLVATLGAAPPAPVTTGWQLE